MAYNEKLANQIRAALAHIPDVAEKEMMGGLTFMVNGKMCIGIVKDDMMCRIDPTLHDSAIERVGCRTMDFTARPMRGYVFVNEEGRKKAVDFMHWVGLCLAFNPHAKASKKRK